MKHLLKEGKITRLFPEDMEGGMSGEVHLVRHKSKRYVLRKCKTKERADLYERLSKKFEKYGFLPKLISRHKNNLFFEYLTGRDLMEKDSLRYAEKIGRICGIVNNEKLEDKVEKFDFDKKFIKRLDFLLEKKIIDKGKYSSIKNKYEDLKRKIHPKQSYDLGDVDKTNFRLSHGKIYFVDMEGVNIRLIGMGFAKPFLQWFKTEKQRENFLKGYNSVRSSKFLTKDYLQFVYLFFLVSNVFSKYGNKLDYSSSFGRINKLLKGELR